MIYLGFKIISNIYVIFFKPFISDKISSRRVYQRPAALRRQYRVVMMEQRQLEEKDEVKLQSSESSEAELEERVSR